MDDALKAHMKSDAAQVLGTSFRPESAGKLKPGKNGHYSGICPKCSAESNTRLCPNCHGELPPSVEEIPGYSIYVVGSKGCGKSHYLVAAFEHLENLVFPTKLKSHFQLCTGHTKDRYRKLRNSVFQSGSLMAPTNKDDPEVRLPFLFQAKLATHMRFFYGIKTSKSVNIAAFDTPGEVCESHTNLRHNWQCLVKGDALIFLIDPTAYNQVRSQLSQEARTSMVDTENETKAVIDNIAQLYRSMNPLSATDKISIPTAFVLTKVDALKGLIPPSSPVWQEADHKMGFDRDHCEQVSDAVKDFLHGLNDGAKAVMAVESGFSNYMFFAVTSLGQPPKMEAGVKSAVNINPKHVENPWLWILFRLGLLSET